MVRKFVIKTFARDLSCVLTNEWLSLLSHDLLCIHNNSSLGKFSTLADIAEPSPPMNEWFSRGPQTLDPEQLTLVTFLLLLGKYFLLTDPRDSRTGTVLPGFCALDVCLSRNGKGMFNGGRVC